MERQSHSLSRKKSRGLVGLIGGALVGAAALMPAGKAEGGFIFLNDNFGTSNEPKISLYHETGATDGYDSSLDLSYTGTGSPIVDFFSQIPAHNSDPTKLSEDKRDISSTSTYHTLLQGKELTYPVAGTLSFILIDPTNDFPANIWADVYKNGVLDTDHSNIDVRDYASKGTQIPLSLASNSDVYNIDVRFVPEPGTLSLLAMAGIGAGAGYLVSRKKRE